MLVLLQRYRIAATTAVGAAKVVTHVNLPVHADGNVTAVEPCVLVDKW